MCRYILSLVLVGWNNFSITTLRLFFAFEAVTIKTVLKKKDIIFQKIALCFPKNSVIIIVRRVRLSRRRLRDRVPTSRVWIQPIGGRALVERGQCGARVPAVPASVPRAAARQRLRVDALQQVPRQVSQGYVPPTVPPAVHPHHALAVPPHPRSPDRTPASPVIVHSYFSWFDGCQICFLSC